jgi:hypothetical protein
LNQAQGFLFAPTLFSIHGGHRLQQYQEEDEEEPNLKSQIPPRPHSLLQKQRLTRGNLYTTPQLHNNNNNTHTRLNQSHFNSLLYLCSNSVTDPLLKPLALSYGFRIYDHMLSLNIKPNEASITAVARLAATKGDGDYAL